MRLHGSLILMLRNPVPTIHNAFCQRAARSRRLARRRRPANLLHSPSILNGARHGTQCITTVRSSIAARPGATKTIRVVWGLEIDNCAVHRSSCCALCSGAQAALHAPLGQWARPRPGAETELCSCTNCDHSVIYGLYYGREVDGEVR